MRVLIEEHHHEHRRLAIGQRGVDFIVMKTPRGRTKLEWLDAFIPVRRNDFDVMHSVNSVPVPMRRPFVISFEDYCPRVPDDRYNAHLEWVMARRLRSDRCHALLPWSTYALRQSSKQLNRFSWGFEVIAKMEVVPPPVTLRETHPKRPNPTPRLLFVGAEYGRKGGISVARAHRRLRAAGIAVETTVVSSFRETPSRYVSVPERYRSELPLLDIDGMTVHQTLPNDQVLKLMRDVDFLVLPTLHDTYGYSSAEALAAGTPVIASNTAAQPDIVTDGKTGWLLDLPNDPVVGRWQWVGKGGDPGYDHAFETAVSMLTDGLVDTICRHLDSPVELYEQMSAAALEDVRLRMSTDVIRTRLEQIYLSALAQ